jgi:hypothetical protein
MTNKQVMQLMTELGLHEGGMLNWIKDNAFVKFARRLETLVRDDERRKCAADYLQDCVNAVEAARLEEREKLAKQEPVVSFTDNEEGLCIQLACNGSYYWQNLSESKTAKFFVDAYRKKK